MYRPTHRGVVSNLVGGCSVKVTTVEHMHASWPCRGLRLDDVGVGQDVCYGCDVA